MQKIIDTHEDNYYMLDSGAYTLMSMYFGGAHHRKGTEEFDYDEFMEKAEPFVDSYIEFLYNYGKYFKVVANMDIQELIGSEETIDMNDRFKTFEDEIGVPVCYVFHDCDKKYWHYYLDNYNFIGLASGYDNLMPYARQAMMTGHKVHCFGVTNTKIIRKLNVTTVDSVTWLMATKFGATFYHRGGRLKRYDHTPRGKQQRFKMKAKIQRSGLDWKQWITENPDIALEWSIKQWMEYQESINKRQSNRQLVEEIYA